MIDRKALLADLKKQVGTLEGELRERAGEDEATHARLHGEWQKAREANRIAATYESWLDERVTQAAVAWVLGTVFLRFCEDNGLIEAPFLAGPGEKLALAQERQADHISRNPHDTDRHWILAGFAEMSRSPVAAGLFDKAHNPMWQIEIPHHAAKELLAFWRRRGEDGEIVHDFTDPEWDTRFLGDLYQDLSDHAKKTYALLQTPEFVEEFILDYTLEPAIDEFGLDGLRLIDPTCGSGHFLLGAFNRILNKWRDAEPATEIWTLIRRTLLSVHGVDKNPFATNIARFRMLVAVMKAGKVNLLARAPGFPIVVATGDSLLHGRGAPGIQEDLLSEAEPHTYATEDIYEFINSESSVSHSGESDLLGAGSYHVVVGNPPYITVKDKQESAAYKAAYRTCSGQYGLSAPFMERFFQLCIHGARGVRPAGFMGQITANAFMKREFGKKLINDYLPTVDVTSIVDTSGAYIPGHGTPTVILFGRRRWPVAGVPIRAVLGIRGEPTQPVDPIEGLVWQSIVQNIDHPGNENEWVTVADVNRESFSRHPWSLSGGGAASLSERIESAAVGRLSSYVDSIGFCLVTREDDAYMLGRGALQRKDCPVEHVRILTEGQFVRDWGFLGGVHSIFPYDGSELKPSLSRQEMKLLWPLRVPLKRRKALSGTQEEQGLEWYEYSSFSPARYSSKFLISFPFVATHPTFSLRRDDRAFIRTAPVIKLPEGATEDEHLQLLGVLNSSTSCFWLKQVSHNKGRPGAEQAGADEPWEHRYEFTGTKLEDFPIPPNLPIKYGRRLDGLAQEIACVSPSGVAGDAIPSQETALSAKEIWHSIRGKMVAVQEELDWDSYFRYGLLEEPLVLPGDSLPEVHPGERAFEIVLARKILAGETQTTWFQHHNHQFRKTVDIPSRWPEEYKRIIEKRIKIIESRRDIALLERPEHKRRWATDAWEKREKVALRDWLLDRCEDRSLWYADDEYGAEQPSVMTVNQLADRLRQDEDFVSVARLYAGDDADLPKVIAEITQDEHIPHLAALRYKDSGLRKRAQWEDIWEQQREEDRTGKRLDIPVPPKYTSADFLKPSYWRNRGKLDVPKERFISYPGSSPDGDSSMLLGWAGWDHREQAQALMMLIEERATQDGWGAARLTPLLAGLAEVMPWVRQWHGEVDPAFGQSPADAYLTYLESKQAELGISDDDLKKWRPEKPKRGGRKKKDA